MLIVQSAASNSVLARCLLSPVYENSERKAEISAKIRVMKELKAILTWMGRSGNCAGGCAKAGSRSQFRIFLKAKELRPGPEPRILGSGKLGRGQARGPTFGTAIHRAAVHVQLLGRDTRPYCTYRNADWQSAQSRAAQRGRSIDRRRSMVERFKRETARVTARRRPQPHASVFLPSGFILLLCARSLVLRLASSRPVPSRVSGSSSAFLLHRLSWRSDERHSFPVPTGSRACESPGSASTRAAAKSSRVCCESIRQSGYSAVSCSSPLSAFMRLLV